MLIALNSIKGGECDSPCRDILRPTIWPQERLSELLTSYAYDLGYKTTLDNVSSPVEISDIENEIRDNGDIFDTSIFEISQNEYDRGVSLHDI